MVFPIAIAAGALLAGGGIASAFKGASTKNTTAQKQYYGGTEDAQAALLKGYADQAATARQNAQGGFIGDNVYKGQQGIQTGLGYTRDLAQQGRGLASVGANLVDQGKAQFSAGARAQMEAARAIQSAVDGTAPSQAELLMRAQAGEIGQRANAMAATARGGNQAAAMRAAIDAGANAQLNAAGQAAALRAQEMAVARQQLAQLGAQQYQQGSIPGGMGLSAIGQGMGAQQFGAQAQLNAGQYGTSLETQRELAYQQMQQDALRTIYGGEVAQEQARAAEAQRRSDRWWQLGGSLVGAGGTVMGMGMGSGLSSVGSQPAAQQQRGQMPGIQDPWAKAA